MKFVFSLWFVRKKIRLLVFSAVIFASFIFFGRHVIARGLEFLQKPFVSTGTWIGNTTNNLFGSCSVRKKDLQAMREERNFFAVERTELELLRSQNDALRQEIGFLKRRQFSGIPSAILSRSVSYQNLEFTIDAGKREGIVLGAAAVIADGLFVGKVTRVEETFSVVSPSTSRKTATAVTLLNQSRTIGIAEGATGNLIELKFIPAEEAIRVNDLVVTSGLESGIPSGLVVGIVNTVRHDPEAPFQQAILEPLVDVRFFDHVVVLLPSDI